MFINADIVPHNASPLPVRFRVRRWVLDVFRRSQSHHRGNKKRETSGEVFHEVIRSRLDQAEVAALSAIENVHPGASGIQENEKLAVRHLELEHGLVDEHRFNRKALRPDDGMLVVLFLLGRLGMQHMLVEMLDDILCADGVCASDRVLYFRIWRATLSVTASIAAYMSSVSSRASRSLSVQA